MNLNRKRRFFAVASLALLMLTTTVVFNNCSNEFVLNTGGADLSSAGYTTCQSRLYTVFSQRVYPFTKSNCVLCHTSAGPANDPFSDSNRLDAFESFFLVGFTKFKSYGTNPGHAPGMTGTQNLAAIEAMEPAWNHVVASGVCAGEVTNGTDPIMAKTISKTINAPLANNGQVRSWNLASELESGGSLAGATFEITVRQTQPVGGKPTYYFSNPTIKTGSTPLQVNRLKIWINGFLIDWGTTFLEIEPQDVPASTTMVLKRGVMLVEMGSGIASTDTMQVSFGTLKANDGSNPTPTPPGATPTPTPVQLTGAQLYAMNCANCHGALANSTKRGRSFAQIKASFTDVPSMSYIKLTDAQIQLLVDALK